MMQKSAKVRLVPPRRDIESQKKALELAKQVRDSLAALEAEESFDQCMAKRRGRSWSPTDPSR